MHHSITAPVAVSAVYAHPIEYILTNGLPVLLGPCVTGCHVVTLWMYAILVVVGSLHNHCGYDCFSLLPATPAIFHDIHHSTFRDNYGSFGLMDWLHSTAKFPSHVKPRVLW